MQIMTEIKKTSIAQGSINWKSLSFAYLTCEVTFFSVVFMIS